jgi:hypothetical protein
MAEIADAPTVPEWLWSALATEAGQQDPFPLFRALGESPVCSHAAAERALKDPRFTALAPVPSDRPFWRTFNRWLIMLDGPKHTAIRRLIVGAFSAHAVERYRPLVNTTVARLIDELAPAGEMDLRRQFACRLPTEVIADLMDLPESAREGLEQLLSEIEQAFIHQNEESYLTRGDRAMVELLTRMNRLLVERQGAGGSDLLSRLAAGAADPTGAGIEHDDLVANAVFLLQAGHETTMNALTSGVYMLLVHTSQLERLRNDLSLIPAAVEEILPVRFANWHCAADRQRRRRPAAGLRSRRNDCPVSPRRGQSRSRGLCGTGCFRRGASCESAPRVRVGIPSLRGRRAGSTGAPGRTGCTDRAAAGSPTCAAAALGWRRAVSRAGRAARGLDTGRSARGRARDAHRHGHRRDLLQIAVVSEQVADDLMRADEQDVHEGHHRA